MYLNQQQTIARQLGELCSQVSLFLSIDNEKYVKQ
jgi:hypothetical protein